MMTLHPPDIDPRTDPTDTPWWIRWRPAWHSQAACSGRNDVEWFPTRGEPVTDAITICTTCPVRTHCLTEALTDPSLDYGIWGGMGARNRQRLRARQQETNEAGSGADQQSATDDEHATTTPTTVRGGA